MKYRQNYQKCNRQEVSKCGWKNGTDRPALCRVATNLPLSTVKKRHKRANRPKNPSRDIPVTCNKAKRDKSQVGLCEATTHPGSVFILGRAGSAPLCTCPEPLGQSAGCFPESSVHSQASQPWPMACSLPELPSRATSPDALPHLGGVRGPSLAHRRVTYRALSSWSVY